MTAQKNDGAIGGGVITYTVDGAQRIAVATDLYRPLSLSKSGGRRIELLGLESGLGTTMLVTVADFRAAAAYFGHGVRQMLSQPRSPTLDLLGSYFPAWMLCAAAGVVVAVFLRQILMVVGVGNYVVAPLLTYAGFALSATWAIWLLLFGH